MNGRSRIDTILVAIAGILISALVGAGLCFVWLLFNIGIPFSPAYERTFLLIAAVTFGTGFFITLASWFAGFKIWPFNREQ